MSISTTPPEYKEKQRPRGTHHKTGHKKDGPPKGPVL